MVIMVMHRFCYTGEMMIMCGGSPLDYMSGSSQERRCNYLLSFSPLYFFVVFFLIVFLVQDDGEIHRVDYNYTLVLPSLNRMKWGFGFFLFDNSDDGEIHRSLLFKKYSRSPPMNRNMILMVLRCAFNGGHFMCILCAFY